MTRKMQYSRRDSTYLIPRWQS